MANKDKCAFGKQYRKFLGHVVGQGKLMPAQCKVDVLVSFVQPRTKKGVRQFVGLSGYYRKFIPEFSARTFHLMEAAKKDSPDRVLWSEEIWKEFEDINVFVAFTKLA